MSYLKAITDSAMLAGWFLWLPLRVIGAVWLNAMLRLKEWKWADMAERVIRMFGLFLMGAVLIGVESIPMIWCIAKAIATRPAETDYMVGACGCGTALISFGWVPFMMAGMRVKPVRLKWLPDWYTGEEGKR